MGAGDVFVSSEFSCHYGLLHSRSRLTTNVSVIPRNKSSSRNNAGSVESESERKGEDQERNTHRGRGRGREREREREREGGRKTAKGTKTERKGTGEAGRWREIT